MTHKRRTGDGLSGPHLFLVVGVTVLLLTMLESVTDRNPLHELLDRSYVISPAPGDWKIESNGIEFRYSRMDSTGAWVPTRDTWPYKWMAFEKAVDDSRQRHGWEDE